MPVTWSFNGPVLTLSVIGVVTNDEIEQAFDAAIVSRRGETNLRLLWDARASHTALSSADMAWRVELVSSLAERGIVSRVAVLIRSERSHVFALAREEIPKALPAIQSAVFTEPTEAQAWLQS